MSIEKQSVYKASSIGFLFVLTLFFFAGLGLFIDKKIGTTPVFLIVGFILGFIGALISVFRLSGKLLENTQVKKDNNLI